MLLRIATFFRPLTTACAVLLLAGLAARTASAQTASYTYSGSACTGGRLQSAMGPVPFSVSGLPRLGQTFDIVTEGSHNYIWDARRFTYVLTGSSNTRAGGIALPFDISQLFPGDPFCGLLRTSGEVWLPVPYSNDPNALVAVSFAIPNDAALLGVTFYQQAISLERTTFGPPFRAGSLSRGGTGVIGR